MLADLHERLGQVLMEKAHLDKLRRRQSELEKELREAGATAARLKEQLAREEQDAQRLEGLSLATLFYTVLGSREEQLEKERQEALAAQLRYEEAAHRQAALQKELDQVRAEAARMAGVEERYKALLREKEAAIERESAAGARELAQLTEREHQVKWQIRQLEEARSAGLEADAALARVEDSLDSAEGWGTWDMLGGGTLATWAKHSRMDDARAEAHTAQRALQAFRRELKDVAVDLQVELVELDGFTRFADYFFDGLIVDWTVQQRIHQSLESVRQCRQEVGMLLLKLDQQRQQAEAELAALQQERQQFIESFGG